MTLFRQSVVALALFVVTSVSASAQSGVAAQKWDGATLVSLQSLADNPDLLGQPSSTVILTGTFQLSPRNVTGVFVRRYFAYATAPATAYYTFWLEADQFAQSWWSTDPSFATKYPLAKMTQAIPPTALNFLKYSEQVSAPIPLSAGQKIYIMAVHVETSTAAPVLNHFAIGWGWKPNALATTAYTAIERPIPQSRLMPWGYPARVSLTANPMSVNSGQASNLSWILRHALSCTTSATPANANWAGSVLAASGTRAVTLNSTTTFGVACSGYGSNDASYATVTVIQPVTGQMSGSPQSLNLGEQATLTWAFQNATSCSASAIPADPSWTGSISTSGSATVVPSANSTYYTTCSGSGSSFTAQVAFLVAGVAAVVNPRMVEFDPSADHNAVIPEESPNAGLPVVSRYDLGFYYPGAAQPVSTYNLGKPNPEVDGKIRYDFTSHLMGFPIGTFEARVTVVGPTGSGTSEPSNPFSFIR